MPLTAIAARTPDFELLLPALVALTEEVEGQRVHGCKVLDAISRHASSGIPLVQACMQRILAKTHMVLYAQISAWIMYGMLADPSREFFIYPSQRVTQRAAHGGTEDGALGANAQRGRGAHGASEEAAAAVAAGYPLPPPPL